MKEILVWMQTPVRETLASPSLEAGKEQAGTDLSVLALFLLLLTRHLVLTTAGHQTLGQMSAGLSHRSQQNMRNAHLGQAMAHLTHCFVSSSGTSTCRLGRTCELCNFM